MPSDGISSRNRYIRNVSFRYRHAPPVRQGSAVFYFEGLAAAAAYLAGSRIVTSARGSDSMYFAKLSAVTSVRAPILRASK